jgi:hypothetical protein
MNRCHTVTGVTLSQGHFFCDSVQTKKVLHSKDVLSSICLLSCHYFYRTCDSVTPIGLDALLNTLYASFLACDGGVTVVTPIQEVLLCQ